LLHSPNDHQPRRTSMNELQKLFLTELADRRDAEKQLVQAMPAWAALAKSKDLRTLINFHLEQTEDHVEKLDKVFSLFNEEPAIKKCEATVGLLKEAVEIVDAFKESAAIDAALISITQKIAHYEIASYGCLREWATLLGNKDAASLLKQILEQEDGMNHSLIALAQFQGNKRAMGEDSNQGSLAKPVSRNSNPVPVDKTS